MYNGSSTEKNMIPQTEHIKNNKSTIIAKRIFDVAFSSFIVVITLPLTMCILVAIKITQILRRKPFAPLFYKETRISRGAPFTLYKFNIFKTEKIQEARANGEFIHTKQFEKNGDITWIGWLLKQIYVDELPQIFCVLKGDMSLVGPRPVNPKVYYEELSTEWRETKGKILAGITGHQQSQKQLTGKGEDLDREYVDYYLSKPWYKVLIFDLKILLRTFVFMAQAKGI